MIIDDLFSFQIFQLENFCKLGVSMIKQNHEKRKELQHLDKNLMK